MRVRAYPVFRLLTASGLLFGLLAAFGCGGGTGDISGTVTHKGKPLDGGQIQFQSDSGKIYAADIGKDGKYTVPNVPTGSTKVAVSYVDPRATDYFRALSAQSKAGSDPVGRGDKEKADQGPALPPPDKMQFNKVPERYNDFNGSGLSFEVTKGPNTHEVNLDG